MTCPQTTVHQYPAKKAIKTRLSYTLSTNPTISVIAAGVRQPALKLVLLAVLAYALCACGKTGPLYLPDKAQAGMVQPLAVHAFTQANTEPMNQIDK